MPRKRKPRSLVNDGRINRRFLDELRSTRKPAGFQDKLDALAPVIASQVEQIEGVDAIDDEGLTIMEAAFVREYMRDGNGTRSVLAAGYRLSRESAHVHAYRLLRKHQVASAVKKRQLHLRGAVEITLQDLVMILAPLCTGNLADITKIGESGEPYFDLSELTRDQFAAIQELTVEDFLEGRGENAREVRRIRVRLADRIAATRTLAEILGILRKRVEIEDVTPQPIPQEVVKRLSDDQLRRLVAIGERAKAEQRAILGETEPDTGPLRPATITLSPSEPSDQSETPQKP
jgi:phage terminase small subunit